jgi:outer membrane protein assembly factor BamB
VVRCEAGAHPEVESFEPPVVLDLDVADYDPLRGQVFRGSLLRDGVYEGEGPRDAPDLKWSFETQGRVRSSPVVVNGLVYVGSDDGSVYALDAETGELCWQLETGGPVVSSAAVVDGVVYIGSTDSYLYAIGALTGDELWSLSRGPEMAVTSSPAVAYGVVFAGFGVWGSGALSGIDAATGEEVWRYRKQAGPKGTASAAIVDDMLICPSPSIWTYAADLCDEQPVWTCEEGASHTVPAIADGMVFWLDSRLNAVDLATGELIWQLAFEGIRQGLQEQQQSSPAVRGGVLYVGTDTRQVLALDAATGEERWRFEAPAEFQSSPALAGDTLYIGCRDGHLYALDATTGAELWRLETGGPVQSSPWVADGVVFCGSDDGIIYAIE